MAPLMQSSKYPIRVAGPRRMIAARISAEGYATKSRVDEEFTHAAPLPPGRSAGWSVIVVPGKDRLSPAVVHQQVPSARFYPPDMRTAKTRSPSLTDSKRFPKQPLRRAELKSKGISNRLPANTSNRRRS